MVSSINQTFQKILNIGVSKELKDEENQRIRSLNIVVSITLLMLFSSLSTNLIFWSWTTFDNVVYIGIPLIAVSIFILNYFKKYQLARISYFNVNVLLIFFLTLVSGDIFIVSILYIIFLVTFFYFVEESKLRIMYSLFQLLLFSVLSLLLYGSEYYPNPTNVVPLSRIIVYTICYILLYILINFLMNQIKSHYLEKELLLNKLKEKNSKIENAYKEMEEFAYVISHDIKAPLRNMNNFAELIEKDLQKGKFSNLETYSKFINDSGSKLSKMIDDVLSYSQLNNSEVDRTQLININNTIELIGLNIKASYSNFIIEADDIPPINGNKSQLMMLFQNLIENGIKYNKSKTPKIDIRYKRENDFHRIEIADNGIGISEQHFNKIFGLFSRLHRDDEYKGTGIGLANCKRIVENYLGGSIDIESEVDKGSTFIINIPLVTDKE